MELKRLSTLLLSIGISIMLVSITPINVGMGGGGPLDPGGVQGCLLVFTGPIAVTVAVRDNYSIWMYVLDWDDTLNFMQSRVLDNCSPTVEYHNITSFNGMIDVPAPGVYSLIIESTSNETIYLDIDMYHVFPQGNIFIPGLLIAILGSSLFLLHRVYLTKKKELRVDSPKRY